MDQLRNENKKEINQILYNIAYCLGKLSAKIEKKSIEDAHKFGYELGQIMGRLNELVERKLTE